MKSIIIIVSLLVAVAVAAPQAEEPILEQEVGSSNIGLDAYKYGYEYNRTMKHDEGDGTKNRLPEIVESNSWEGADGETHKIPPVFHQNHEESAEHEGEGTENRAPNVIRFVGDDGKTYEVYYPASS